MTEPTKAKLDRRLELAQLELGLAESANRRAIDTFSGDPLKKSRVQKTERALAGARESHAQAQANLDNWTSPEDLAFEREQGRTKQMRLLLNQSIPSHVEAAEDLKECEAQLNRFEAKNEQALEAMNGVAPYAETIQYQKSPPSHQPSGGHRSGKLLALLNEHSNLKKRLSTAKSIHEKVTEEVTAARRHQRCRYTFAPGQGRHMHGAVNTKLNGEVLVPQSDPSELRRMVRKGYVLCDESLPEELGEVA